MEYYDLTILQRGAPPSQLLPGIRPAREIGKEVLKAEDDEDAIRKAAVRESELGPEFLVSLYVMRDGERIKLYPGRPSDA